MTDRLNALVVVLEVDMRDDDAQPLIDAIKQLRGVLSVTGNVSDLTSTVAETRAKRELYDKVWALCK